MNLAKDKNNLKKIIRVFVVILFAFLFQSLIVRHDVPDEKFIELAKQYPQICHLPMGEGTLIDSSWVLTAGHIGSDLLRDMNNGYSPTVKCNGKEYKIEKVFVHPEFKSIDEGLQNDIALIKITGKVDDVVPAKIYDRPDEKGLLITIVGMGDMGNGLTGPQKWDKITRAATNKIDGTEDQWLYFSFDSPESGNATSMEGISGPGDSGGPAFIELKGKRFIVGVSSNQTGQEKFGKGRYGVTEYYSRISSFRTWVLETIKRN